MGLHPLTALWGVAAAWYGSSVMSMDFAECDRARVARDPSYDGRFFTGVRTTGIYCRPVCPVRPARSTSVQFLPSATAGKRRGFGRVCGAVPRPRRFQRVDRKPCNRRARGTAYRRRGRSRRRGSVGRETCRAPGHGSPPTCTLVRRHLKASPSAVARTARVQRAKRLLDETDKSMVGIAVLAGFGSLRRFNAVFAEVYGTSSHGD
jgi:AraC family transcriptional regulator, regulatory protein of adaptative response / methylated-DNA-[protein]-cysteine methyltransferase